MGELQDRLRDAMALRGVSGAELARRVGCTQPAVSTFLSGGAEGWKYTVRAARALGVSPDWLEAGVGSPDDYEGDRVSTDVLVPAVSAALKVLTIARKLTAPEETLAEAASFVAQVQIATDGDAVDMGTDLDEAAARNSRILAAQFKLR